MRVRASSAPNGSSSSSSAGSRTSAPASAARWASPPDRVLGQSFAWSARPTSSSAARTTCRDSRGRSDRAPRCRAPSPTAAAARPGTRPRGRSGTWISPVDRRRRDRRGHAGTCSCPSRCDRAGRRTRRDGCRGRCHAARRDHRSCRVTSAYVHRDVVEVDGPHRACCSSAGLPSQQPLLEQSDDGVGDQTEHRVDEEADDDHVGLEERLRLRSSGSRCRWCALICSANTSSSHATAVASRSTDEEAGHRAGQDHPPDLRPPARARRHGPARGSRDRSA